MNADLERKRQIAASENSVLRFVAALNAKTQTASVQVQSIEKNSALGQAHGTDNVFHIVSQRYPRGLTIAGAGAGASVTAMGLFSDILGVR
jgi:homoserine dehydrogenase